MTLRVLNTVFDHVTYDAKRDVLYLSVGEPSAAADSLTTSEGHVLRYDDAGHIIGLTLVNAKWLAERDGTLNVTPPAEHIARDVLAPAFA